MLPCVATAGEHGRRAEDDRREAGLEAGPALVALALTATGLAAPVAAAPRSEVTAATPAAGGPAESVAYQADAAHDGHVADPAVQTPLTKLWSRDFAGSTVSYPLVTGGRMFVTTQGTSTLTAALYALDPSTGADLWGPLDIGSTYGWTGLAAGGGEVYVLNFDGYLAAYSQATGHLDWITKLAGQYTFTSPPTYSDGVVYSTGAGSGGTLYATDAATGTLVWSHPVTNGDHSSPAVSATGVYTSFACELTTDNDPNDGHVIWSVQNGCEGGGGRTAVLAAGGVWVRDAAGMSPVVYDQATGSLLNTFTAGPAPAFDGSEGFFLSAGTLKAKDAATLQTTWSATGDGGFVTAPFVVDGLVYEGSSSGTLFAFDEATGAQVWASDVGVPFQAPDEHNVRTLPGMAAGGGVLAASAGGRLVAFASAVTAGYRYQATPAPTACSTPGRGARWVPTTPRGARARPVRCRSRGWRACRPTPRRWCSTRR